MNIVLTLLLVNAALGAFDTLWYHEYRNRLSARIEHTRPELRLHAARDAVYVVLYGGLAWWTPAGAIVAIVAALLAAEIVITLADFVIEDRDRPLIGGISPGERILHSLMAIVYGTMLAHLIPVLLDGAVARTATVEHGAHLALSIGATAAAVGIAVSGFRDALALVGVDPIWRRRPAPPAIVHRGPRRGSTITIPIDKRTYE
ncbi:MAG: hypothetical protein WA964_06150 [Ilumatobacter sp.]|uniref:hypothetical protein n=1 Tax=Ilumatobacter sp. TaxID=1967498 RepID=UPI003C723C91